MIQQCKNKKVLLLERLKKMIKVSQKMYKNQQSS